MRISDWSSDVCSSDLLHSTPFNALIVAAFAICMAAVIVENARMFVSRQLDAFAITRKNATAMLMLREYEEAHGDWLWQVDDQGRLVHLTDRMARMLDRDSDDLIGQIGRAHD